MSSGPLDFFELNITCSANTECYTHGLNLECRRTGYCGCMWSSSMGPAPVCNELTPASSMNLVTTGDDQSTPGGFSQRATDGAAPEEKPAEAYIKLTNASLRDQNPDDDEEEDEYYKWKAAKANQVAPEP